MAQRKWDSISPIVSALLAATQGKRCLPSQITINKGAFKNGRL